MNDGAAQEPEPQPQLSPNPQPSTQKLARVVTSQRTSSLGFVDKVLAELRKLRPELLAEDFFTQRDIDETAADEHWMTQWLRQAQGSAVIPCFVDRSYLESGPCCKEYLAAKELGKLVLIALDEPEEMGKVSAAGNNGPLVTHFLTGGQCLLAFTGQKFEDPKAVAQVLADEL